MMAVLRKMGCEVGVWTKQELSREDAERVKKAARKNKEGEKEQRKVRRRRTVKLSEGWTWKVCIGSVFPRLVLICLRSLLTCLQRKIQCQQNASSAGKAPGPPKYLVIMCCTMLLTEC